MKPVFTSSNSIEWETPQDLFDRLNNVFDFRLDACATSDNAKCKRFFTVRDDALVKPWTRHKRVWMNPPYGREMPKFLEKAYRESQKGCIVVCLIPARPNAQWWQTWVKGKAFVTFLKGTLKFTNPHLDSGDQKYGAPFASAIVIYGVDIFSIVHGDIDETADTCRTFGTAIPPANCNG